MRKGRLMTKQDHVLTLAKWFLDTAQVYVAVALFVLIVVLLSLVDNSDRLHGTWPKSMLTSLSIICGTTAVLILALRLSQVRCKHGSLGNARALLLPMFLPVLWLILNFGMAFILLLLWFRVDYTGWEAARRSGIVLWAVLALQNFLAFWVVWALFRTDSLSFPSVARAIAIAGVGACLQALVNSFEPLVIDNLKHDRTARIATATVVILVGRLGVVCWMYGPVLLRQVRSRRRSLIPFGVMSIVASAVSAVLLVATASSVSFTGTGMHLVGAWYIAYASVFTAVLYYSLWLDTQYWRGVSRKPVWVPEGAESPYGAISHSIISTHLPLLLESERLTNVDFAFLRFGKFVGAGTTARVFEGEILAGAHKGTRVAIKAFTPMDLTEQSLEEFREEAYLHSGLVHPNIVKSYGVCVRPPDICMLTEFCPNGSLDSYLRQNPNLPSHVKLELASQVARAVAFLHTQSPAVVHRDIKAENFLVDGEGVCKLTDFGTSVMLEQENSGRKMSVIAGSACWMSPEILQRRDNQGTPSDVYSLAVVLWEIWCQSLPYKDKENRGEIFEFVLSGKRMSIPRNCPPGYRALIEEAWREDPAQRPTALEIAERLQSMC